MAMDTLKVTGALIQQQAEQPRRLRLTPERAGELASDIACMNDAVIDAADQMLDFNDEPGRLATLLVELRQEASKQTGPYSSCR
jgi:hypothetical protein